MTCKKKIKKKCFTLGKQQCFTLELPLTFMWGWKGLLFEGTDEEETAYSLICSSPSLIWRFCIVPLKSVFFLNFCVFPSCLKMLAVNFLSDLFWTSKQQRICKAINYNCHSTEIPGEGSLWHSSLLRTAKVVSSLLICLATMCCFFSDHISHD